jgi:hypothetical protein
MVLAPSARQTALIEAEREAPRPAVSAALMWEFSSGSVGEVSSSGVLVTTSGSGFVLTTVGVGVLGGAIALAVGVPVSVCGIMLVVFGMLVGMVEGTVRGIIDKGIAA